MNEAANAQANQYPFHVIDNKTARSLQIKPREGTGDVAPLIIPPFGARRISNEQYACYDFRPWIAPGLIESFEEPKKEDRPGISSADKVYTIIAAVLVGVGVLGMLLPGVLEQVFGAPPGTQNPAGILTGIMRSGFPLFLLFIIAAPLVLATVYLAKRRDWFRQGGGSLALGLVAVSVIAVAAVGPVLIMMSFRPETVPVTGRMMEMIFVVIAALLPALLYFLYDRQKVSIVRVTHGGMAYGAGTLAAKRYGAAAIVDPRPAAVGSLRETFRSNPHLASVLPAMGYGPEQIRELEQTINAVDCDLVLIATPVDLRRLISFTHPACLVTYEFEEIGGRLRDLIENLLAKKGRSPARRLGNREDRS